MLPLLVNLRGRRCLVVGGGAVGTRKRRTLAEAGVHVRVVCLEPPPAEAADVEWLTEPYQPRHLDGIALAVAAATPEVNRRVAADARARGVWVNSATDPEEGDVVFPAALRRGDLVLAVGTGGHAPALARTIRDRLAGDFDAVFGDWVALLAELRPLIRERVPAGERRGLLEGLCRWEWLERLRREGTGAVRTAMFAAVEALAGGAHPPL